MTGVQTCALPIFEDAIRNAISIGGDSDTIAAITGSIAEGYYGIPENIKNWTFSKLDDYLKIKVEEFRQSKQMYY